MIRRTFCSLVVYLVEELGGGWNGEREKRSLFLDVVWREDYSRCKSGNGKCTQKINVWRFVNVTELRPRSTISIPIVTRELIARVNYVVDCDTWWVDYIISHVMSTNVSANEILYSEPISVGAFFSPNPTIECCYAATTRQSSNNSKKDVLT